MIAESPKDHEINNTWSLSNTLWGLVGKWENTLESTIAYIARKYISLKAKCPIIYRLQNSPFLRQRSEKRVLTRGREMGERGEEGVARPGEKGNGERGGRKGLSALHSQSQYRISSAHNIKHDTLEYVQAIQLTTSTCVNDVLKTVRHPAKTIYIIKLNKWHFYVKVTQK